MSSPESLKDIYVDELRDLWSANHQMQRIVTKLTEQVGNAKLKQMLERAAGGIKQHTDVLKGLVESNGGKAAKDHCKGMEGLVKEAEKHALDEDIEDTDVRDVIILAQYQRMCHYGLAGFGTAAAYAKALGQKDDEAKLKAAVGEVYKGDEAASQVAERTVNLAAKSA